MAYEKVKIEVTYEVSSDITGDFVCDVIVNELEKSINIDLHLVSRATWDRIVDKLNLGSVTTYVERCSGELTLTYDTEAKLEHVLSVLSNIE